jgi:hypothetical protein
VKNQESRSHNKSQESNFSDFTVIRDSSSATVDCEVLHSSRQGASDAEVGMVAIGVQS